MRDVKKFLGLANYYRQFVKNFAKVALPITNGSTDKKRREVEVGRGATNSIQAVKISVYHQTSIGDS